MTEINTKQNQQFVGIDIAKRNLDICLHNNEQRRFANDSNGFCKLIKILPSAKEVILVMEPTGGYEKASITALQKAGYRVILANAMKVRRYAEAMGYLAKNDAIDSYVIKSFAEDMYPKGNLEVLITKSDNFKSLESWLNRSRQLVKMIATEKQRLEKCADKNVIKSIRNIIKLLEKELDKVTEKINNCSDECKLTEEVIQLQTVPGIGEICAKALVTYLPELGSYNNKTIAALVGVAPYCKDSGKVKGKKSIRGGRGVLRSILYMGILSAIKHNPIIKKFYDRLIQNGKHHNVAMIASMRKMLCILNSMMRNKTEWQPCYSSALIDK